mmetsp:Transcript_9413/g.21418  ORF Transcript_9413/g.21418 Transcript_9413/m.21418 type:complete len:126 (-) Transcript_9413:460-837(-)
MALLSQHICLLYNRTSWWALAPSNDAGHTTADQNDVQSNHKGRHQLGEIYRVEEEFFSFDLRRQEANHAKIEGRSLQNLYNPSGAIITFCLLKDCKHAILMRPDVINIVGLNPSVRVESLLMGNK